MKYILNNIISRFKNEARLVRTVYLSTTLLLAFSLLLGGCGASEEKETTAGRISAKVVKVVDGDTLDIQLENGQSNERIRLLLVDTPESVHPKKPVQPFGREASDFAKKKLQNRDVEVEFDVSERDKYGRLLAYIWVDGQMFNEELLREGFARVAYVYPPNVKYVDQFREVQTEARKAERGIWSIENYATEKGFDDSLQASDKRDASTAKGSSKSTLVSEENESSQANDQNDANSSSSSDSSESSNNSSNSAETCQDPKIKGNINRDGEKIYHTTDSSQYKRTKAEQMFCTEQAAKDAGFRAAKS
ncbi:thermonuclease family protein [Paenibacillus sp. 481]|uniref:thermonuclease family protein n=1 Tax=Paenibacillus sp. 481 TaxID=2835869 RepID=UPI001E41B521|nr:thermonuclease family protein [Paenibacillus sp. 481]UHA72042.1 thermonuclease family protein [Paenibacillus sp. 481]